MYITTITKLFLYPSMLASLMTKLDLPWKHVSFLESGVANMYHVIINIIAYHNQLFSPIFILLLIFIVIGFFPAVIGSDF